MGAKTSTSFTPREHVPGPGEYTLKSTIGEDKKYSLAGRYKTPRGEEAPGIIHEQYLPYRTWNVHIEKFSWRWQSIFNVSAS
jgi:hypothetical protein